MYKYAFELTMGTCNTYYMKTFLTIFCQSIFSTIPALKYLHIVVNVTGSAKT